MNLSDFYFFFENTGISVMNSQSIQLVYDEDGR